MSIQRCFLALKKAWSYVRSTPWLYESITLGATVAMISSTSALAYSSALMRFPKISPTLLYSTSMKSALQQAIMDTACHECNALRMYTLKKAPSSLLSPLLGFSMDTLAVEMVMSILISFIIVTFSIFLVREMR
ncbi:hypothetical protein O6H91_11G042300 [Diphasiastrum complanatum]|uniref:Uncharacterized protein n=1 Tax=Diphasiastrum complanatum TaxID=34168 RepID=A0ACC2C8F5_DIPCM|nr:hypothetical protein O6H91_11G042300 [Diphasiastrum complanatum]